ncbi:hypothetical protein LTS18_004327, partial [Coniosporium uncinatum]
MKLNQVVSVKGPWRDPSSNELEPFETLGTWKGTGDLVWNSQPPLRLSFKELPHGHSYDADGFVILPEPIALQSFAVAIPQDTLPSQYPRDHIEHNNAHFNAAASDTSPHDSDRRTAVDRLNASEIPSLEDQQVSRAAEMRPERQLRSMQQSTSLGKRARNEDDTHRTRERNKFEQRDQARASSKNRELRQTASSPALHGIGRTRKSNEVSMKRAKTKDRAGRAAVQRNEEEPFRHTAAYSLLLADDCVSHALLDSMCPARKYTPGFNPTPDVQ